jgi:hypothetical protein
MKALLIISSLLIIGTSWILWKAKNVIPYILWGIATIILVIITIPLLPFLLLYERLFTDHHTEEYNAIYD